MENNNNKIKVIEIEQMKMYSYCMKFLRFLRDLERENVSQASVFKTTVIAQLV